MEPAGGIYTFESISEIAGEITIEAGSTGGILVEVLLNKGYGIVMY